MSKRATGGRPPNEGAQAEAAGTSAGARPASSRATRPAAGARRDSLRDADPAEDALRLADDVVSRALKAGATEAEALVMGDDSSLTRFANSEIHQNVAETSRSVNLRFVLGRRIAVLSSGRTDDEGLRLLVERAAAVAPTCEELEDWGGLPSPSGDSTASAVRGWSSKTAAATPEFRADGVRAVISAADEAGVTAYGSFSTGVDTLAVANSAGIRAAERRTSSQMITVSMSPGGGSGYAEAVSMDVSTIDAAAIGREAAAKARASDSAVSLPPGDYPVVLEEYAVVDITDMLGYLGFSALAVQEGRSFVEPGKRIGSDLVTIVDDGADAAGLPMAFDYEGVPKQRLTLVEAGICREVVYDAQTAAREGRRSTGHGLPAPNPYGPFPLNTVMTAGSTSRDDLIAGLDRGLVVTRFHYTNPVHPKLAIITGMTRDGTFLVEDGRIVGPVRNLRYTQSYLDALSSVSEVSSSRKAVKGFLGCAVVPALRIEGWTFTGATEH